ncbi:MAG: DUF2207 domain-containing protein [Fusobacteriaceae bacterium]
MLTFNFSSLKILILFISIFSWSFSEDFGYYIQNYDIGIVINEKNEYSIQEKIDVFFNSPRRGIIRSIPSKYGDRNIKLSNLKIDAPYSQDNFKNGVSLKIGDSKVYLTGKKTYNILYNYDMGWDGIDSYDEVYYNLIGNQWDTTIEKVNFKIVLPKEFDATKINFTFGEYGATKKADVTFKIVDNSIIGFTNTPLNPGEALTLAMSLPQNYFQVSSPRVILNILKLILHGLAIIFPILGLLLWIKFGKNKPFVETVEFYPPNNMNPCEIGYFIDGSVDTKDITSLLIYWAEKGYLNIVEDEKKGIFKNSTLYLEKLKNIEATDNQYEEYLFENLFSFSENDKILYLKDLENKFYKYIEKTYSLIKIDLFTKYSTLYTRKSLSVGSFICSLPLISVFFILLYNSINKNLNFFTMENLSGLTLFISLFPFLLLSNLVTFIIGTKTKRYTENSHSIIGRTRGFKNFLMTAEKERLEMLIHENPKYFYDILPYTIVLGVSDKWANKFVDLVKEPPNWYRSNTGDIFMMSLFMGSFTRSLNSFQKNAYSIPPSNRGPGSSSMGGGSAGGGAGGGGGSSW